MNPKLDIGELYMTGPKQKVASKPKKLGRSYLEIDEFNVILNEFAVELLGCCGGQHTFP